MERDLFAWADLVMDIVQGLAPAAILWQLFYFRRSLLAMRANSVMEQSGGMGVCRNVCGNLFPGAAMADAHQPISQHYREAAEQVRRLARRSRLTDVRGDLLALSASYERMAVYADAAIRLGAAGYPHGELLPVAHDRLVSQDASGPIGTAVPPRELDCIRKRGASSPGRSRGAHWSSSDPHASAAMTKSKGRRR
jgi:hypothetical protein